MKSVRKLALASILFVASSGMAAANDMLRMAIYMGGGPSVAYGAQALQAYDQFSGT